VDVLQPKTKVNNFTILESHSTVRLHIFGGQKLTKTCSFVGRRNIVQQQKISTAEILFQNPKELQSWRCSKILLSFLMRFGRHFLLNQQQQQ
jgi:hypothetical protein